MGQGGVFGGKCANGYAVTAGERVVAEFVADAVFVADHLGDAVAGSGNGWRLQSVSQFKIQGYTLLKCRLQLVGQFGVKTAADEQLSLWIEIGNGAGGQRLRRIVGGTGGGNAKSQ